MALLDDILTWSINLPEWQRDALRRLFEGDGQLSATDFVEVRAMLEKADDAPAPAPLAKLHIPTLGAGTNTILTGLTNLANVNGFPPGRSIALAPTGISVIFGENGAGKSGFARVMKRACRARHSSPVLPNAFSSGAAGTPKATLSFTANGTPTTTHWMEGTTTHADLAMVSVYDSNCATDYISRDGPCAFLPYGLNILGALGNAQAKIQQAVDREAAAIRLDRQQFAALSGTHAVGQELAKLGPHTDIASLNDLAKLGSNELERITELEANLKAMNVEPAARAAETLSQRLASLVRAVNLAERFTSEAALDKLAAMSKAEDDARTADHVAQALLVGEDDPESGERVALLDGTGGDAWKILFVAAETFSRAAYPHHEQHPAQGENDKCVLCQQGLDSNARLRMERFRAFVAADAAKNLASAHEAVTTALRNVFDANLEPVDAPTLIEIRERDPALAASVEAHQASWKARRKWMDESHRLGYWEDARPPLPSGDFLSQQLTTKAHALLTWATEHRRSKDPTQHAAMQVELAGLRARRDLRAHLPAINLHVEEAKRHAHLTSVSAALNTQKISAKVTALAKEHVTQTLADALNQDLASLGYKRNVKPVVTSQTRSGSNIVGLALDGCTHGADKVLSEGEQRAIGLAFFLAEARLRGDLSTLVFDDPTTSLDHHHRRRIANHLVEVSTMRPVVVLTHDAVFLTALQQGIARLEATHSIQSVQWGGGGPGEIIEGLGWESLPYKNQMHQLRLKAGAMVKNHGQYPNDSEKREIRAAYTELRGAIERATREIILHDTIHPFVAEVKVVNLGGVVGFDLQEWEALMRVYGKGSEATSGHDTPPEEQADLPSAQEFADDVEAVDTVVAACKARSKVFDDGPKKKYNDLRNAPRRA